MAVFQLQNWKFGLDTRRSELTSQPGTLEVAQNVHINQGAEIENRKAFIDQGANSANVFGLDVSSGGLVQFGSAASGSVTIPAGTTYIQCAHPTDSTKAMTALLCSCNFGGDVFSAAKFGTETYLYFNGIVIPSSIAGQILTTATPTVQTNAQIAAQMFNILSGQAFNDTGIFVENLSGAKFNIYTAYGTTWVPNITTSIQPTSTGVITTALLSTSTEPVNGSAGPASLTLYAGNSGQISTLNDIAGAITYKLITSAVAFTTDINTTIANLSSAINTQGNAATNTPNLAPVATSSTNTVSVTTTVNLPSNYLRYITTGNLCLENMSLDFSGVSNGTSVKNIYTSNGTNAAGGQNYGAGGITYGNPSGTVTGHQAFKVAYGTYLFVFGANDTSISVNGTVFSKAANPNGVAFVFNSGTAPNYILWHGAANQPLGTLYTLTDILASVAGITYNGNASDVTAIAAAITANVATNGGIVASNFTTAAQKIMYISRRSLTVNASAYQGIYFYSLIPGIAPSGFVTFTPPASYGFGTPTPSVTGRGTTYSIVFSGTWLAGDSYAFDIVTPAQTYTVGTGRLTGVVPSACLTLSNRVHFIAGKKWYGSDNGDAAQWEQQAAGAFAIDVSQNFRQSDVLVSLAAYQGRMALFANYSLMIFGVDANPQNITLIQPLANTGSFCPLGPQSLGELDVVYPSITGLRSLRVRDLSLNAYVNDLGSPIDMLIQADINTVGFSNLYTTCGIVEPSAGRYWFYINGKIYVLSYFPSAKIMAAWTMYTPTCFISSLPQTFVPIKFVIFNSQVYFIATVSGVQHLFLFGGTNNTTYDTTVAIVETPWMDLGKPGNRKQFRALDFAQTNSWQFSASMDYYGYVNNGGQLDAINSLAESNPSFQLGSYGLSTDGFHVKLKATCTTAGYSVLSALDLHYELLDEK